MHRHCQFVGNKCFPYIIYNIVTTLRSDTVATSWQRSAYVVATLQRRNFTKCLTSFQRCVSFALASILVFLGKLPYWGQHTHKLVNLLKVEFQHLSLGHHANRFNYEPKKVGYMLKQRQNYLRIFLNATIVLNLVG